MILLADRAEPRSLRLEATGRDGGMVTVTVEVRDGERSWTLTAPLLADDEARELAAWLAGLPGDRTLGAGEWTALTFERPALTLSGRRIPGGGVELRVAVLGMRAPGAAPGETTDVVIGLSLAEAGLREAAGVLLREVAGAAPGAS